MTNNFIKILKKVFGTSERVNVQLDPESVRNHQQLQAVVNENLELKGRIGKYQSEEGKRRESVNDKNEDEEVRWELDRQKKEIQRKSYPHYFSLKTFFNKLNRDKKFRERLGFYDFRRSTNLGKFGDFGISADGKFILTNDEGVVLMAGYDTKSMFQSVSGLGNDISTGKIPLNSDEKGNYVENLIEYEMPTTYQNVEGKIQFTVAKKKAMYEYVQELQEEVGEKNGRIEELEHTVTQFSKKISEYKVAKQVAVDSAETDRSNLSEVTKETSEIQKMYRNLTRELSQVRNSNAVIEDNLESVVEQLEVMRKKAEKEGIKLSFDTALEDIQRIRRELVRDEPTPQVVQPIPQNNIQK